MTLPTVFKNGVELAMNYLHIQRLTHFVSSIV